jgi:hypothetical protein
LKNPPERSGGFFIFRLKKEQFCFSWSAEPLYPFVSPQFRTENRFTLFLELLYSQPTMR